MEKYAIENNHYLSLVVDVTKRCNMKCSFCWNEKREDRDIKIPFFTSVCKTLPGPTLLKLSGGEPTLHPDLGRLIEIGHKYGHKITIVSNGLKYADPGFLENMKALANRGIRATWCISLDGGYRNKHAYEVINGSRDYLEKKIAALNALIKSEVGRVCLTGMIVRDLNEDAVPQLIELANRYSHVVRYIHFRNAAKVGKWVNTEPYSMEEMKALVGRYFDEDQFKPRALGEIHCPPESNKSCCYRFRPTGRLQVSIIGFATKEALQCPRRGRLVLGENVIRPFFASMV